MTLVISNDGYSIARAKRKIVRGTLAVVPSLLRRGPGAAVRDKYTYTTDDDECGYHCSGAGAWSTGRGVVVCVREAGERVYDDDMRARACVRRCTRAR